MILTIQLNYKIYRLQMKKSFVELTQILTKENSLYIYYMELEQVVMVILILVIVYMLLQMSQQQQQSTQSDNVVLLRTPYFGYNFGQGPMWRGPRPGGRRRRWRRRGRRFFF